MSLNRRSGSPILLRAALSFSFRIIFGVHVFLLFFEVQWFLFLRNRRCPLPPSSSKLKHNTKEGQRKREEKEPLMSVLNIFKQGLRIFSMSSCTLKNARGTYLLAQHVMDQSLRCMKVVLWIMRRQGKLKVLKLWESRGWGMLQVRIGGLVLDPTSVHKLYMRAKCVAGEVLTLLWDAKKTWRLWLKEGSLRCGIGMSFRLLSVKRRSPFLKWIHFCAPQHSHRARDGSITPVSEGNKPRCVLWGKIAARPFFRVCRLWSFIIRQIISFWAFSKLVSRRVWYLIWNQHQAFIYMIWSTTCNLAKYALHSNQKKICCDGVVSRADRRCW